MLALAPQLMRELGVTNGFRTVINTGQDGGQEVYHLHRARHRRPAALAEGLSRRT